MIDVNDSEELRERSASHTRDASGGARATLLTDGGDEAENGNGGDEAENGNGDETRILYLDVEGLFLDLLGLEVDLDEVVLDVSAVPGSGNILGNLLSAVARVLDGGLSDVFDGILPDDLLPDVLPDEMTLDDRMPSLSDVVFGFVNILLDMILDALEDGESADKSSSDTQQS